MPEAKPKVKLACRLAWISAAFLLSPVNVSAAVDLREAYQLAESNDPQWSSIKHNYQTQKENYYQARSQLLPRVSLGAEFSERRNETEGSDPNNSSQQVYTASVSQPLFRLDSWYAFKQVKASDQLVDAEYQAQQQDFLIRVLNAYLAVLRANETLAFSKAEESAIARQKDQTEQRYQVGLIAKTDVHEAQAAYDIAVVQRIVAERDLDLALKSLETLTGTQIDAVAGLEEDFPIQVPQPNDIDEWVTMALNNNKSLIAATYNETAAMNEYEARRAQHYPTLELVGSYQKTETDAVTNLGNTSFENPDSETTTIALQLDIPLYTGGQTSSLRRQAKSLYYRAQDDKRFTERDVSKNTSNLVRVVQTHVAAVNAQQQSIRSAQSALDATRAGYEAGTRTIVDVLNAQRTLYQAKRNYADARFNYILDSLRLKQLAGVLTEQDLLAINQWLR
ncbi:MAG: TolC family outer membrane protein [Ketobacteraceae bacterium]|nr:TolC family outer membrane protein [Ketobacteraceae bacterium]